MAARSAICRGGRRGRAALLPGLRDRRSGRGGELRGRHAAALVRRAAVARRARGASSAPRGDAAPAAAGARPAAPTAARVPPARRAAHRGVAGRGVRSGRPLRRARRQPAQGLPADEPGARDGRGLAAHPHRARAGGRARRRLARRALPLHARRPASRPRRWRACSTSILTLHADHELNASTFAARVAVATVADLHAAVVAAIATLKGPRHGGANEDVLAMLLEIGEPALAEAFVEARIGARAALSKRERAESRAAHARLRPSRLQGGRRAGAGPARAWPKSMAEATGRGSSSRWRSGSTTR